MLPHTQSRAKAAPLDKTRFIEILQERRETLRSRLVGILPADAPLTLELGCGHGHFLTAYAQAHPNLLCIGIDIVGERIERAQRKRDRAHLTNLHFIRTEGNLFLTTISAPASIAEMFILFPDPWPKSRHHKHRIIQSFFLSAAARAMPTNAKMCFRTDHRPYFDDSKARISDHGAWELSDEAWPFEYNTVFQTRASTYYSWIARRTTEGSHKPDTNMVRGS